MIEKYGHKIKTGWPYDKCIKCGCVISRARANAYIEVFIINEWHYNMTCNETIMKMALE